MTEMAKTDTISYRKSDDQTYVIGSSTMFNTPGVWRWIQHVDRTDRIFAVRFVAELIGNTGLPERDRYRVARGMLAGVIPVQVDEDAGTISFAVAGVQS
jgi:hypothetical protein